MVSYRIYIQNIYTKYYTISRRHDRRKKILFVVEKRRKDWKGFGSDVKNGVKHFMHVRFAHAPNDHALHTIIAANSVLL